MKKLFLIDGNSFCYRAFYAIRGLSNSKGQPTNAVYGFVSMINKIIKDQSPDYFACAFDLKGPTFRHKKYQDYKAHRKPMPDDLVSQMPIIKKVLDAYNIKIYELEGYEADDVLAAIVDRFNNKDVEVYIVTGDKDAMQLVGPKTFIYQAHKEGLVIGEAEVKMRFGVAPDKIPDVMALMGDASDNIPGVPGIGEKTAVELLSQFGSLEEILKNPEKIKSGALRKKIEENKDTALLSRELAVMDKGVPLKIDLEEMTVREPNREGLIEIFRDLEFRSLLKDIVPRSDRERTYKIVASKREFDALLAALKSEKAWAFDFETTGEDPMRAGPVGLSFALRPNEAFYIPLLQLDKGLDADYVWQGLKGVFEDVTIEKIGQNIKYDYIILFNQGVRLKGIAFDTMVASYINNPSKLNHNLSDIAIEFLNRSMTPIEELIGKGKNAVTMDKVSVSKVSAYCCEDSDAALQVKGILEKKLREKALSELFHDLEMPLVEVLAAMEINGVAIDTEYLKGLSKEMARGIDSLTRDIYKLAGCEFNINSTKQLQPILFEKLKLPVIKRTKTGISTDEEVLAGLAGIHELPRLLLEYRQLAKLKSTYVDNLPALINPVTKRLHASFNQTVTQTGRLSSSDPNLQNIPIRTETGRRIRKAFIPGSKNSLLLSADYSQIELRILAHLSQDKNLTEAFKKGHDIHAFTASLIFGADEKDVTPEMRNRAKTVNFGIIYGMSAYGLSKDLGIDVGKAQEFIDSYFERYPDVKLYLEELLEGARRDGYVTTIMGRRRYIPEITSENIRLRNFAERTAINAPIQGSSADLIKKAMINIHKKIRDSGALLIIQVHDELVFEVPKKELLDIARLVKKEMEEPLRLNVPIKVGIEAGDNWLDMKELIG